VNVARAVAVAPAARNITTGVAPVTANLTATATENAMGVAEANAAVATEEAVSGAEDLHERG